MDKKDLEQAVVLISKDFHLELGEFMSYEELLSKLTKEVTFLLNKDFEKLLQICYRVDLGELTLNRLLHETDPEHMSEEIAKSLINRQLQKIELRRKYSS
ncbi:hypothetical protein [Mongoliitalea lutea]|uniref:Uncharacterized protein n=1 Tax=Mongoliitalea lutea TaxID=849756 RepID=A0A8J3CXK2_9BACT|nr:hypothetical protein [Mongoliitalea lutea]GHB44702.1 hypothetical protein GCM10008106_27230 [Mongoliitalea lutea]